MKTHHPVMTRRRARRARGVGLLIFLTMIASSCTFQSGQHMEVDFLGARYRFYIYEKPTAQLSVDLRHACVQSDGSSRRAWTQCSLDFLRDQVNVPSIGRSEWRIWTGADQWDDYGGAVDAVRSGGFRLDSRGERYALNCLVGDHFGFRSYNWTTRAASDGHCKRGVNAA
jgi:hypothetical protein